MGVDLCETFSKLFLDLCLSERLLIVCCFFGNIIGDFLLKLLPLVASPYDTELDREDVELDDEKDKTDKSAITEDAEAHEAPDEGVDE